MFRVLLSPQATDHAPIQGRSKVQLLLDSSIPHTPSLSHPHSHLPVQPSAPSPAPLGLPSPALQVRREKAVFHVMNQLSIDVTRKCLVAEAWCPVSAADDVSDGDRHACMTWGEYSTK